MTTTCHNRKTELILVTGLSGAGRATTARILEDFQWQVSDNVPIALIEQLVDYYREHMPRPQRIAIVVDVRSQFFTDLFRGVLERLKSEEKNCLVTTVFLDSSDAILVQRFEGSRRRHPLQEEQTLNESILTERTLLVPVRELADLIIDTSRLSIPKLREKLRVFAGISTGEIAIHVQSFGFKRGIPRDTDILLDVRFIPNPFWIPELRDYDGHAEIIQKYVLSQPGVEKFVQGHVELLELLLRSYGQECKQYLNIAIGCTGGKHRSVVIANKLSSELNKSLSGKDTIISQKIRVLHRDVESQ